MGGNEQSPAPTESVAEFVSRMRARPREDWVNEVRRDQAVRWSSGQRVFVEEYFRCCPELTQDEEDTLVLIGGEVHMRRTTDPEVTLEEYQRRFPRLVSQLNLQFQLDQLWPAAPEEQRRRIVCPVCHNTIQATEEIVTDELVCASCGSSFRLEPAATSDWFSGNAARTLGKYQLLEAVGVGSFGHVYKAHDAELDRIVAVKVPRAANLANQEDLERFLREARSVARLRHPSIVAVHEIGQFEQTPYLVSEFVQGVTLADWMSARRPAPREAAEMLATLADALEYAHEMGVIHRDVKPANIMLDEKGTPRLMDFGLAKRDAGDVTMTMDGQVLGTPAYMSPEQAKGESHKVDGRSDVYSLGVILYQLLTGELPFRGTTRMLLHQVLHDEPRRPRSLSHLVPRDLETICLKCLEKDPRKRYSTAGNMADELRRFLQGEPIQARAITMPDRVWRWCKRNPGMATLGSGLAAVLLILGIVGPLVAIRQSRLATEKTQLAEENAELAENERQARKQVAVRADELARRMYLIHLANTDRALLEHNYSRARAELDACPQEQRGWEWQYLVGRIHATVPQAFPGAEQPIFSRDGKRLIAIGALGTPAQRMAHIWDLSSGALIGTLEHESCLSHIAMSPDEKRIAGGDYNGNLFVRDAATGKKTLVRQKARRQVRWLGFQPRR